jgi:hypothetical protein
MAITKKQASQSVATGQESLISPEMAGTGFYIPEPSTTPRLVICTQAREKKGKTDWALRTCPMPCAVVSTDTGTKEVLDKLMREFPERRGRYLLTEHKVPTVKIQARKAEYELEWEQWKNSIIYAIDNPRIRTLVVDTGTEVWEMLRLARFGKIAQVKPHHYSEVNAEMRDLFKAAYYQRPDLNAIWVHKVKKEYKELKTGDSGWSGKYERAGFGDIGFLADMVIEHDFNIQFNDDDQVLSRDFTCRILDSRINPELTGELFTGNEPHVLTDQPMCSFRNVAMLMFPETDAEYWR